MPALMNDPKEFAAAPQEKFWPLQTTAVLVRTLPRALIVIRQTHVGRGQ
jgi:hypothetical protein